MTILMSIIIGAAVAFFAIMLDALLRDGGTYNFVSLRSLGFVIAGVGVGLMSGFTATATKEGLIFFLVVFALLYAALTAWNIRECGRWRELALFLLVGGLMCCPTMAVATLLGEVVSFWAQLIIITLMVVWLINLLFFKSEVSEWKQLYKGLAIVVAILLVFADLCQIAAFARQHRKQPEPVGKQAETTEVATPAPEPTPQPEPNLEWYHFYNSELLEDEDAKNDFNFGTNPLSEILQEKLARGEIRLADLTTKKLGTAYGLLPEEDLNALVLKQLEAGEIQLEDILDKPESELYKLVTAEELFAVMYERLEQDPALGAADLAWVDFNAKTRYLGKFYDEVENNWDAAINESKSAWMQSKEEYERTLEAFKLFAAHAKDIKITRVFRGLDDQMYMNPFTVDGVPDVIVMESLDMGGYFLTFVFNPKGGTNDIEISFRVDCGFQPTNVSAMGITVQKNPNKPTHSGGGTPTSNGGGTPKAETGGGEPQQTTGSGGGEPVTFPITNPKDSSIYPVQGKNEEQGPGKDTNNGVGATMSSAEVPTSTRATGMSDGKREYWDEENERINQTQRIGGDSNAPSDRSEPVTGITDNAANGNKDTGSAPIDNRTQTSNPITLDGGRKMENTGDNSYGSFTPPGKVTETKPDTHAPSVFDGDFGANE